jgi:hypothetical protein
MSWDFLTAEFIFRYIVPSITAIVAVYISFKQKSINKAQQKLSESQHRIENEEHRFKFYEKRAAVFRNLEKFLSTICGNGKVTLNDIENFEKNIWPDQWLFPNKMYPYFQKILEIAKKNHFDNEEFKTLAFVTGEKEKLKDEYLKKSHESFDWLENQKKNLYSTFENILRIPSS